MKKNIIMIVIILICSISLLFVMYNMKSKNIYYVSENNNSNIELTMKLGTTEITSFSDLDSSKYYRIDIDNTSCNNTNTKLYWSNSTQKLKVSGVTTGLKCSIAFEEITEDVNILSMTVNGSRVDKLSNFSNVQYYLKDYECSNGELITWDIDNYAVTIKPLTSTTYCTVDFITTIMDTYITDGLTTWFDGIYNNGLNQAHSSTITTWKDLSGNNYNGTVHDTVLWADNSLVLQENYNNFVSFEPTVLWGGYGSTPNMTIEIVSKKITDGYAGLFEVYYGSINGNNSYMNIWSPIIGMNHSGCLTVSFNINNGNYVQEKYYTLDQYSFNKIQYVSYQKSNTNFISYDTNMNKIYDENHTSGTLLGNNSSIYFIGINRNDPNYDSNMTRYYFKGNIYSVRVYNRVLSEKELLINYELDKYRYGIE